MTLLAAILIWLVLLALITSLLRRLPWLPGLAVAAGLALLALQLWQLPTDGVTELWGRLLTLDRSSSMLGFSLAFGQSARGPALLLLAWGAVFAIAAAWMRADRVLFPAIPLILAALFLTLSSTPLLWSPFWLVIAAVLMAFPAQGASPRLARAALRTLAAPVLALPFFLFTAWVLGQPAIAADDPELWGIAWRSLALGVAILLTPIPLHGWIIAQGEHAPPFAAAFLVGAWQITIYALVREILLTYPTLADYADPASFLPWLAVIQMVWAGLFGLSSNRLGQLWGYLLLFDFGATLLLWSLSGELGTQAMIWMLLARPLALVALAAGIQTLENGFGENAEYSSIGGGGDRLPVATLAVVVGGLFLLGWPLGALFPARLSTLVLAEAREGIIFLWAMLALLLMTLGLIRVLRALTQPLAKPNLMREPAHLTWLLLPLLLAGALLALNPALLDPITSQIADWMTQL